MLSDNDLLLLQKYTNTHTLAFNARELQSQKIGHDKFRLECNDIMMNLYVTLGCTFMNMSEEESK